MPSIFLFLPFIGAMGRKGQWSVPTLSRPLRKPIGGIVVLYFRVGSETQPLNLFPKGGQKVTCCFLYLSISDMNTPASPYSYGSNGSFQWWALKSWCRLRKCFHFPPKHKLTLALGFRVGVSKIMLCPYDRTLPAMVHGPSAGGSLEHTPIVMYGQHQPHKGGNEDSSALGLLWSQMKSGTNEEELGNPCAPHMWEGPPVVKVAALAHLHQHPFPTRPDNRHPQVPRDTSFLWFYQENLSFLFPSTKMYLFMVYLTLVIAIFKKHLSEES